jgi:hypothetical protein
LPGQSDPRTKDDAVSFGINVIDVYVYFDRTEKLTLRPGEGSTIADLKKMLVQEGHAHAPTDFALVDYRPILDIADIEHMASLPDNEELVDDGTYLFVMQ